MKIGIDAHNLEGSRTGTGRYLINLLKHWHKQSNVEFVLYFKNSVPEDLPVSSNFKTRVLNTKSNALFMHYHLCRAATKDKLDVLFCPNYIAPIFYRGKIALVLHDIIYEARPDLYNWPSIIDKLLLKKVSKISAKKAEIIFTCSQFSKNEILKHYKVDPKKVFVIPLAADEKFVRDHLDTEIKKKFIFYVGAIIKRRFISRTIQAFQKVKKKLPEFKFLIIGKNHTGQEIKEKGIIHKNHVDDHDLALLYSRTSLFVWLSEYEGFGLPPLEAMACGAPVLSTKKTSLSEVLGDYPIWIEDPENINEISEKMYRILTSKKLQEKLIKKGFQQVQKFSWDKTAQETFQILIKH